MPRLVRPAAEGRRRHRAATRSSARRTAPNEYNPPAEDGSRPAVFFINAYQAEKQEPGRSGVDGVPRNDSRPPPAGRDRARAEGDPSDRPLPRQPRLRRRVGALRRAARRRDEAVLVGSRSARHALDARRCARRGWSSTPGIHTLGWTRQQAIDYMLAHTAEGEHDVASEVDRYIIYPGQATAYMLGDAGDPRGARRGRAGDGREVRHQGVPRSRARGRRRAGDVSCTTRSARGQERRNDASQSW